MRFLHGYLSQLSTGKTVLWYYLIWYLLIVARYFDPAPAIWLNSLGLSAVIGTGLLLSVGGAGRAERWQTFRLFFMPFAVSSFSSLIKGRGFVLVLPPSAFELALCVGSCAVFVSIVAALKRRAQA